MASSADKVYQVGVCLFNGADILDFLGPIEILSHALYESERTGQRGKCAFEITQIATTDTIIAGDLITITPNVTYADASKMIEKFDILVVPGGPPPLIMEMAKPGPEVSFIKAFNALGLKEGEERIILSVCTGALLVGASGALNGLKATTHHMALDLLKQIDGSIDVLSRDQIDGNGRYVDSGRNAKGVRVVTAGGVTCGLDASLYVAELKAGRKAAEMSALITEYDLKRA